MDTPNTVNTTNPAVQEDDEISIDIMQVLRLFWAKLPIILLVGVILAGITGFITKRFIKPTYQAAVQMYVLSNPEQNYSANGSANNSELNAAKSLADIYSVILKSNTVLDLVVEDINGNGVFPERKLTRSALAGKMSVSTVNSTAVMKVSVRDKDPVFARAVAEAFAIVAPPEIIRVTKAGSVEIVDHADVPRNPVAPNVKRYVMIAFLAGVLLTCAFYFLRLQMDHTLVSEEDLKSITNIPVLATVPDIQVDSHATANIWEMLEEEGN